MEVEVIEQIFFRKVNPSDFRNMYSVAVPSSGGGQTYIEAAGISDDALLSFLDYAEMIAPTSNQEKRMAYRFNSYMVDNPEKNDFIEFQPRRGRNYRIVRQTENHRHPAWSVDNGFPAPQKDGNGAYVDDSSFTGIIDNLLIVIIRTSYRKYYAWFVNEATIPNSWPNGVGLEKMFAEDRRGILVFEGDTLRFVPNSGCPFVVKGSGAGKLVGVVQIDGSRQRIIYGAPGTGKSWCIKNDTQGMSVIRTTFHPDSDYSTFVGAYKPSMEDDDFKTVVMTGEIGSAGNITKKDGLVTKKRIVYSFRSQAFLDAYVAAWRKCAAYLAATDEDSSKKAMQFLVIEEINRGNCAQIFGDIFQLLDREDDGYSSYAINADNDLSKFVADSFKGDAAKGIPALDLTGVDLGDRDITLDKIASGDKLLLPPNLYIWATMNTSDQSLFPIDSAFKRRWAWKYIPISNANKNYSIEVGSDKYDWWEFLDKVNALVEGFTESEDKKLGYFFCKADKHGVISLEQFVGKVVFYLWNGVFKDTGFDDEVFDDGNGDKLYFKRFFDTKGNPDAAIVKKFMENLGVPVIGPQKSGAETETQPPAETTQPQPSQQ